jgi:hypothetical protein
MFAQLRDVLTAEDSTVMPQEDDHRRLLRPKRPQPQLLPISVGKRDIS